MTVLGRRVLGEHRYEIAGLGASCEASEQGDADVHHALGLRDHDGAPPEPGQPMPLAGVVPLDAMRLLLANIERALRDQLGISVQAIGAGETHAPALQAFEEPLQGSSVTTAQLPVEEVSRRAIPSRPDPELVGLCLR